MIFFFFRIAKNCTCKLYIRSIVFLNTDHWLSTALLSYCYCVTVHLRLNHVEYKNLVKGILNMLFHGKKTEAKSQHPHQLMIHVEDRNKDTV